LVIFSLFIWQLSIFNLFILSSDSVKPYSYFPFSLGPRSCIGQNFAQVNPICNKRYKLKTYETLEIKQIEAKVILIKLIKNFDFVLVPNQSFKVIQYATIRPEDGTKVLITPRI
jgi:cholesterol 24(S)-hydroxylase